MIGFSVVEVFEALRERGYAPFESDVPGVCLEKNGLIVGMHYEKTRGTILDRDGLIVNYGPTPASVDPDPVLSLPTTAHSYIVMLIIEKPSDEGDYDEWAEIRCLEQETPLDEVIQLIETMVKP